MLNFHYQRKQDNQSRIIMNIYLKHKILTLIFQRGDKHWSDQQWAIVILVGFTFFALCIAVIMQQVIAWGIVST